MKETFIELLGDIDNLAFIVEYNSQNNNIPNQILAFNFYPLKELNNDFLYKESFYFTKPNAENTDSEILTFFVKFNDTVNIGKVIIAGKVQEVTINNFDRQNGQVIISTEPYKILTDLEKICENPLEIISQLEKLILSGVQNEV